MLLVVHTCELVAATLDRVTADLLEGVRSRCGDVVVGSSLADGVILAAAGRPMVVTAAVSLGRGGVSLGPGRVAVDVAAAARVAAGVVWVSGSTACGARHWLGIDRGPVGSVPVSAVIVSDQPVDARAERLAAAVDVVVVVPATATGTGRRRLRRLGRRVAAAAEMPRRFDTSSEDALGAATGAASEVGAKIDSLLAESGVEEFQIAGGSAMMVEFCDGHYEERSSPFCSNRELVEAVRFLAGFSGDRPQRFDNLSPRLDIRLGERWRLHAEAFVVEPPTIVLRSNMAGEASLEGLGLCDDQLQALLVEAVAGQRGRANVVIAAKMSGGKTTLCQALLAQVPDHERIDTIEDTPELRLRDYGIHKNAHERLTRDANNDGIGRHTMADHIRDAKRANSQKLVVGEVRGEGTLALLDAMSSGLQGCLVTLHANPGTGVLEKLIAYSCSEGADPDFASRQIAAGVHLLVWLGRNDEGQRVIADVTQVVGFDRGEVLTRCLWSLADGDRWATPVFEPQGLVADLYAAAGVSMADPPLHLAPKFHEPVQAGSA